MSYIDVIQARGTALFIHVPIWIQEGSVYQQTNSGIYLVASNMN